jgi:hypothetical protein
MRCARGTAVLLVGACAIAGVLSVPAPDRARGQGSCTGDLVPPEPTPAGERLRFGITPGGRAGSLGAPVPVTPGTRKQTLAALRRLRPPGGTLVLRLNRFFWSDGREGFHRFLRRATGYTNRGYLVELQLRYHPNPGQEGRIGRWLRFVRHVTRAFGRNPRVVAIQVTNEVNFYPVAPDASDSSFAGAEEALVRGVIAAHDVKVRRGYRHLGIGFNWAYRTDPNREANFWGYLRDNGGRAFKQAVDWVGLDAYPGTIFPPTEPPGQEGAGLVAAMSQLRQCFMPIAGLGQNVPIHVEENGWPTGPGRSESEQEAALHSMVTAASTYRGNYNVTEYRWFDLRDHNTSGENFQQHYGLLRDDYSEKPAFGAYRELIRRLARRR